MAKSITKTHCHKLTEFFKGRLSISDRNYYANLYRLDDLIDNFREEISDNCLELHAEYKRAYYEAIQQKLKGINIFYDQKLLDQKLTKYNEKISNFPEFSNETLNELLNEIPPKEVKEFIEKKLARHSLTSMVQKTFFKYWMNFQKEKLEDWIDTLINKESAGEVLDPRSTKEGLTLTQWVLVGTLDGTLTAAEDFYGKHVARYYSEKWGRPQNKIAAILKKWNDNSHEWMETSAYRRDMRVAQEYVSRYRMDH